MNIKYISLLSLFCVTAADAAKLPGTDRLEQARDDLNKCRNSGWGHIFGCDERQFNEEKHKFLKPHYKKCNTILRRIKMETYQRDFKNARPWQRQAIIENYLRKDFVAKGHEQIVKAFEDDTFLSSDKSTVEFLNDTLENYYRDLGSEKPDCKPEIDAAREKVMQVVHQQAQQTE